MIKNLFSADEFRFIEFRKGDKCAFEFYFNEYYNRLVGFSKQFIGDEDKARSVTQDAFIKLWENKEKVKKINGIQSFLYTSVKSDCLNLIRHQKVVRKYKSNILQEKESSLNTEVLNSMNFDPASIKELESLIEKSVLELPDRCRLVFEKKQLENKKNKEIAQELGITIKAVEANMTRATKFLKLRLANYIVTILICAIFCFF